MGPSTSPRTEALDAPGSSDEAPLAAGEGRGGKGRLAPEGTGRGEGGCGRRRAEPQQPAL